MRNRIIIQGEGISPGISLGSAVLYTDVLSRNIDVYSVAKNNLSQEMNRINLAIDHAEEDLNHIEKLITKEKGKQEGRIFKAHQLLLRDNRINQELKDELYHQKVNAEQIVKNVFMRLANRLKQTGNEVLAARFEDVEEIGLRLIRILSGNEWNKLGQIKKGSIIVAKRLLPADTVHIKRQHVSGFIVTAGSQHSHTAILARSFGITAISANQAMTEIKTGDELLINGFDGTIIIQPNQADIKKHAIHKKQLAKHYNLALSKTDEVVKTKSGQCVKIYANVNSIQDVQLAHHHGSAGIGLYRTEMLYMVYKTLPSVDYLVTHLSRILEKNKNKVATMRLLDVGGDKTISYLELPEESNPLLGVRGIRFLLKHPDILMNQVEAMVRLNDRFNIRLLIPMVTFAEEVIAVKRIVENIRKRIKVKNRHKLLPVGAMLETPAALLHAKEIGAQADFLSIGTNDLIQYTMAASRENIEVFDYYHKGIATVLTAIESMVIQLKPLNKEIYVCGELASDHQWIGDLLATGIHSISVSPHCISDLKEKIRQLTVKKTES